MINKKTHEKWHEKLSSLIAYRKQNPNKWPPVKDKNEEIRKIGVWCQTMRERYRKNTLPQYWLNQLLKIGFNFGGSTENWLNNYNELKDYLTKHEKIPPTNDRLYNWAVRSVKNKKLPEDWQQLLKDIKLDSYFSTKTWTERYEEIKEFRLTNGCFPKSNSGLAHWIVIQRARYKNNQLNEQQRELLEQLDIELDTLKNRTDKWKIKYEEVKKFKELNNRLPKFHSDGEERKLYNWCQSQRQRNAGTSYKGRVRPFDTWQLDLLNAIDFYFNYKDVLADNWEHNFQILLSEFEKNKKIVVQQMEIPLINWINQQRRKYKRGTLSQDKVEKLEKVKLL